MKKPAVWLGIAFLALFLGFLFYSTFKGDRYRCEVCMGFEGRTDCRTAAAETREQAMRAAIENACAQIAGGVTDSSRCMASRPVSVRWLE